MATIDIDEDTRDELRRFKAEHGETYSEAIVRLLKDNGWIDEERDRLDEEGDE